MEAVCDARWIPTNNVAGLRTGVAFFFLFGYFYNFWMDPSCFVYTAEIWPSHLRTEGVSMAMASYFAFTIAWASPATTGFANIGYKYYIVIICVSVATGTAALWLLPETKGLTLEEIGLLFGEEPKIRFDDIGVEILDDALHKGEHPIHTEDKA